MKTTKNSPLDIVLAGLMRRYQQRVPDVSAIIHAMVSKNLIRTADDIENDHIAFRTMGVPHLGIASLEKIFLHYGYRRRERYNFAEKKLMPTGILPPPTSIREFSSANCASKICHLWRSKSSMHIPTRLQPTRWTH